MNRQKKEYEERKRQLISILNDPEENLGGRDDAAMDLCEFDDDEVIDVLVKFGSNENEDTTILDSCGESLAEIWSNRGVFYPELYNKLAPAAKSGFYHVIRGGKVEWVKKYGLDKDLHKYF